MLGMSLSGCFFYSSPAMAQHHGIHALTISSFFSQTSIASHSPRFLYGIHSSGFISKPCTSSGFHECHLKQKRMGMQPHEGYSYTCTRHGIFIRSGSKPGGRSHRRLLALAVVHQYCTLSVYCMTRSLALSMHHYKDQRSSHACSKWLQRPSPLNLPHAAMPLLNNVALKNSYNAAPAVENWVSSSSRIVAGSMCKGE